MEIEELLKTREGLYSFLSRMYLEEPPRVLSEDMAAKRLSLPEDLSSLNTDLREGFMELKEFMDSVKADADKLYDDLAWEYTRLFIGPSKDVILPYESSYGKKNFTGKAVLEAKDRYRKAGISKAAACPEPEDHVALELDFMANLCRRMAEKINAADDVKDELAIQREFLEECLQRWVPRFCDDIIKSPEADFYRGIARITKGFLDFDSAMIEEISSRI
jgi:anaerobic sulfite reductase subunit A